MRRARAQVVPRQLDRLAVPREAYDAIVVPATSPARVVAAAAGQRVFHLGPERDRRSSPGSMCASRRSRAPTIVVCSGLFDDDTETPEDYRALLATMRERRLSMVCANPDIVVERGDQLVYCAGAIADLYAALGGEVIYAGKPYRPIYEQALGQARRCAAAARCRSTACWRSAIRCAPISRARARSASIACS